MAVEAISPDIGGTKAFKLWYENYLGQSETPPATEAETQERYRTQLQLLQTACKARFEELNVSHAETSKHARFNIPFLPKRQDILLENTNALLYTYSAIYKEADALLGRPAIPPFLFEQVARHTLMTRRSDIIAHDQGHFMSRALNGLGHVMHRKVSPIVGKVAQAGEDLTGLDLTPDWEFIQPRERALSPIIMKSLSANFLRRFYGEMELASLADQNNTALTAAGFDISGIQMAREVGMLPLQDPATLTLAGLGVGAAGVQAAQASGLLPETLPEKLTLFGPAIQQGGTEISERIQGIMVNSALNESQRQTSIINFLLDKHFEYNVAQNAAQRLMDGTLTPETLIYQNAHQFLNIDVNSVSNDLAQWIQSDLTVSEANATSAASAIFSDWSATPASVRTAVFGTEEVPKMITDVLQQYNIHPSTADDVVRLLQQGATETELVNHLNQTAVINPGDWVSRLQSVGITLDYETLVGSNGIIPSNRLSGIIFEHSSDLLHPSRIGQLGTIPESYEHLRGATDSIRGLTEGTVQTHDFLGLGDVPILRDITDIAAPMVLGALHLVPAAAVTYGVYNAGRGIYATGKRISYLKDHDEALLNQAMRTNMENFQKVVNEQVAVASYTKEQNTAAQTQSIDSFATEQTVAQTGKDATAKEI